MGELVPVTRAWPLWAAAATGAAYLLFIAAASGPTEVHVTDLVQALVPAVAAAACGAALRTARPAHRFGWGLAALACASWSLGQVLWTYYEWNLSEGIPFPSPADAGYLWAVPLMALGVVLLGPRTSPATRTRILLDGLLTATSLLFIMWVVVIGPIARDSSEGPFAVAVALAYPLGDVVMAATLLNVATRAPRRDARVWLALGLGVAGWAIADSGFAYLATIGQYGTGEWIDAGWVTGFALIAAAATVATRRPLTDAPSDALRLSNLGIPWMLTAIAVLLAVYLEWTTHTLAPFLVWNGLAFVALVLVRQFASQLEIRRLNADLLAANHGLEAAIADLGRAEMARATLEATQKQARYQNEFLNLAAHEMATPMTPIVLELGILAKFLAQGRAAEAQRHVAILGRNFDRLNHLVQDLLVSARLDLGKLRLRIEPTDLVALAMEAAQDFATQAEERGVTIGVEASGPLLVAADPSRMAEVLSNLLSNAIKFTLPEGRVTIGVARKGGEALMRIQDTGIGLDEEQLERLFQPFAEIHHLESTVQSTGLGLYIAKGFVERQGGRIWAESAGAGKGSAFVVALPLTGAAPTPPPARLAA